MNIGMTISRPGVFRRSEPRLRSLVFMQGVVSADGQPVARASGIFKIGPRFEDALGPSTTPPRL